MLFTIRTVPQGREGYLGLLADFLDYISPDMFDGLIEVAIVQKPYSFVAAVSLLLIYYFVRRGMYKCTVKSCEDLRHDIIDAQLQKANKATEDTE